MKNRKTDDIWNRGVINNPIQFPWKSLSFSSQLIGTKFKFQNMAEYLRILIKKIYQAATTLKYEGKIPEELIITWQTTTLSVLYIHVGINNEKMEKIVTPHCAIYIWNPPFIGGLNSNFTHPVIKIYAANFWKNAFYNYATPPIHTQVLIKVHKYTNIKQLQLWS